MLKNKKFTASLVLVSIMTMGSSLASTNFSYTSSQVQPSNYQYYNSNNAVNGYNNNFNNHADANNVQNFQQPVQYNFNQPLQGSVVTVPAGETFPATLLNELSSSTATEGQPVVMVLGSDFYYNNKLIAPAGSNVTGTVVSARKARFGSMNGNVTVRLTQITTPVGGQIPISAVIKTDDSSGKLVGGTKKDVAKDYAKDIVAGSAVGAVSGLVFGALASGDKLGRGAALGTAVGAGGGLLKSLADKGSDVNVPANSTLELILTQPITTTVSNYSY